MCSTDQETGWETCTLPNGELVKYQDETHTYLVRGRQVPSITELLKLVYGDTYSAVDPDLLKKSADYGTAVHHELDSLINLRETGFDINDLITYPETKNYFLYIEPFYKIVPLLTERMVVLYNAFKEPIAAGRFDLICEVDGTKTLADFKTTSTIHRQLVSAQLNLYRRAAFQSGYIDDENISLGVIHLSGKTYEYKTMTSFGEGFFNKFGAGKISN